MKGSWSKEPSAFTAYANLHQAISLCTQSLLPSLLIASATRSSAAYFGDWLCSVLNILFHMYSQAMVYLQDVNMDHSKWADAEPDGDNDDEREGEGGNGDEEDDLWNTFKVMDETARAQKEEEERKKKELQEEREKVRGSTLCMR